eukprot:SAG11_NODE_8493_length_1009_cov_1.461538_1_plen_149_part_00
MRKIKVKGKTVGKALPYLKVEMGRGVQDSMSAVAKDQIDTAVLEERRFAMEGVCAILPRCAHHYDTSCARHAHPFRTARACLRTALAVRAMKAERTMSYVDLNSRVCKDIARLVTADPRFVKKVIEDLIQRGFFERDEDDARQLVYNA